MIKNWQSHQEYILFLHETKIHLDSSQRTRLTGEFAAAREKLRLLNLDPVMELLEPYYSPFGRPALNQTQILRSLILMLHQGFTGITAWVEKLNSDSLPALLIGCTPHSLPPLGSYYDFIDRLWLQDKQFQKSAGKDLFPADKNRKPANNLEKEKNFLTAILTLQKLWLGKLFPGMNSLFITKSFSSRYSVPLPLPHPCSAALSIKTASRFPVTGPASIHMPALMGIKCAAVRTMDRPDVTVRAIILIRMPIGAGTVILELSIL